MNNHASSADVRKWLEYADEDLRAADSTLRDEVFSAACFHAQQAVEKTVKAMLLEKTGRVPKQHSLLRLTEMSESKEIFEQQKEQLEFLDKFYVPTRYPDALPGSLPEGLPGKEDAEKAVASAKEVIKSVKKRLIN